MLHRGITSTALGPFGDSLALGTDKGGVYSLSMADESYSIAECARLEAAVSQVCWNVGSGEVYAASGARVVVLRQN